MRYREDYWHWMQSYLKFNRDDRRFIHEVCNRRIDHDRAVTPKQAELWEILVYKYRRQIQEHHLDPDAMLAAEWRRAPQQPRPEHDTSTVTLRDNHLILRSPYSADQVDRWRRYRQEANLKMAVWNPDDKEWAIPVSGATLRGVLDFCTRDTYTIHEDVYNLLDPMITATEAEHWRCLARLCHGRIIINSASPQLLAALPDDLPVSLKTLNRLTLAGVDIHPTLKQACETTASPALVQLNSEKTSVLPWAKEYHDVILQYLEQHSQCNIVLETYDSGDDYHVLVQDIMRLYANRVHVFFRTKAKQNELESIFNFQPYDFSSLKDTGTVDILINKSRNLINWEAGLYPAQIANKIIYYINPDHDRSGYLEDSAQLW